MKKKSIWLVVSCLMVAALVLASCGPAAVEEEQVVVEEEEESTPLPGDEPGSPTEQTPPLPGPAYVTVSGEVAFVREVGGYPEDQVTEASVVEDGGRINILRGSQAVALINYFLRDEFQPIEDWEITITVTGYVKAREHWDRELYIMKDFRILPIDSTKVRFVEVESIEEQVAIYRWMPREEKPSCPDGRVYSKTSNIKGFGAGSLRDGLAYLRNEGESGLLRVTIIPIDRHAKEMSLPEKEECLDNVVTIFVEANKSVRIDIVRFLFKEGQQSAQPHPCFLEAIYTEYESYDETKTEGSLEVQGR